MSEPLADHQHRLSLGKPIPPGSSINRRRLTLVDGMILLIATAVAFALLRYHDYYHGAMIGAISEHGWINPVMVGIDAVSITVGELEWRGSSLNLTRWVHWGVWSGIAGASLAPAFLILHLLPPRPRIRRVFRAPGAVACVSATLAVAVTPLAFLLCPSFARRFPDLLMFQWGLIATYTAGFAVAASWSTMALGGTWRPVSSWLDRFGRLIGVYWILLAGFLVFCGF